MLVPYLSYSSKGYRKNPDEYLISLHKLSAYLCKKQYGEVHLITDSNSKQYFKNVKFDSIIVLNELDNIPDEFGPTWSLSKLYCFNYLAKNKIPFVHVDYDVFLWEPFPSFIEEADVFVQNKENSVTEYYEVNAMLNYCKYTNFSRASVPDFAYNMGIFGGQDFKFIEDYTKSSIDFVLNPKNKIFWTSDLNQLGITYLWTRAVLAEQWYLALFANNSNKKITCIFDRVNESNCPSEEDAKKVGYTHLWGAKDNSDIVNRVYKRIKEFNL
jgi:hypothetical protein